MVGGGVRGAVGSLADLDRFPRGANNDPRIADALIAAGLLLFLAPFLLILAAAIWRQDGGPAFFMQQRIGRGGRSFPCLKFRTMVVDADARLAELLARDPAARAEWAYHHKLRHDPRVTRLGRFLRRSSLDELPQVFNVLVGHMALVGPRPIVAEEIVRYGRSWTRYCETRPGLTGLWQVSGRSTVNYRRRVALDRLYARRRSPMFDAAILLRTVPMVLMARGSY